MENNIFLTLSGVVTIIIRLLNWLLKSIKLKNEIDQNKSKNFLPLSVNFHFTRKCNYECGFCFHTAKTSYVTSLEEAKRGLLLLKNAGTRKINFSGGEPFLFPKYLGELVKYCKVDLKLESVSIVSNGSKILEKWFQNYAEYLDILAISVDSFDEKTNIKIGRGKGKHLDKLAVIKEWCNEYNVKFKVNSVVCVFNWNEDMVEPIARLQPFRWKVFQCLLVDTENAGSKAIRKAEELVISNEKYEHFCSKHQHLPYFVPESNALMKESYIILDEYMRFLNKGDNYAESESILKIGVDEAIKQIDFDANAFEKRGGVYEWSKNLNEEGCINVPEW